MTCLAYKPGVPLASWRCCVYSSCSAPVRFSPFPSVCPSAPASASARDPQGPAGDGAYTRSITHQSGGAGGLRTHLQTTDAAALFCTPRRRQPRGSRPLPLEVRPCWKCVQSKGTGLVPDQLLVLDMQHGVEAKNDEEIAKAEKE